jgi:hypothetical protein
MTTLKRNFNKIFESCKDTMTYYLYDRSIFNFYKFNGCYRNIKLKILVALNLMGFEKGNVIEVFRNEKESFEILC